MTLKQRILNNIKIAEFMGGTHLEPEEYTHVHGSLKGDTAFINSMQVKSAPAGGCYSYNVYKHSTGQLKYDRDAEWQEGVITKIEEIKPDHFKDLVLPRDVEERVKIKYNKILEFLESYK